MCKPTKKRINFNEDILNALNVKYGYSIDYLRKSIRGDRTGIMPDQLKKEYKKLVAEDKIIKEKARALLQEKANNLN
ncbi:hypothetical protein QWY81_17700 [Polaribacter undariae]|uniref:Uncharacterized protein n=1 Tax=Polaribacter sejongensis TaxID=985043 RepID=A0AAJ1QZV3_9FLAO|nr:hypothetical protein [Polaribacter undariae]MDN3621306.1 hypothetical protein [Polaribacter undariae]UWD31848.1 hypothetical protein NQP51_17165 [Polaribacter undariae]